MLAADDPKTGKPMVDIILDRAGQKGTGKWSVIEAQTARHSGDGDRGGGGGARAVVAQGRARWPPKRSMAPAGRRASVADDTDELLADLELALFAGKIAAYAQGFAVMDAALARIQLEPAAADDRQDLAGRLHHPLAVPGHDGRSLFGRDRSPTC